MNIKICEELDLKYNLCYGCGYDPLVMMANCKEKFKTY